MLLAFRITIICISFLLTGAHFLRSWDVWPAVITALFPLFLLVRRSWSPLITSVALWAAAALWTHTLIVIAAERISSGEDWMRLILIFICIITLTVVAAFAAFSLTRHERYSQGMESAVTSTASFFITVLLLSMARLLSPLPVLVLDRFIPGAGWLEIAALGIYAAWLSERMLTTGDVLGTRVRLWTAFSVVFFLQMLIGISGVDRFLMTGALHVPVPALIVAGPIYRGGGYFMVMLFLATILLVGPAWCSHLCYFGAWDAVAARQKRFPVDSQGMFPRLRVTLSLLVVLLALVYRWAGISTITAAWTAVSFGLGGVAVMISVSRRTGYMMHCTVWCPIGLLADILGRINPFRIRISMACRDCGHCSRACRYGALSRKDIAKRKPGLTCTLCGDCLKSCTNGYLSYGFLRLGPEASRRLFILLIVSLHGAFLGLARL